MPGQSEKARLSTTIIKTAQYHVQNPQVQYQGVLVTTHALFYENGQNEIDSSMPAENQYKFRCPFMQPAAARGQKFSLEWQNAPCPYFCRTNVDLVRHEEGIHSDYRPNKCVFCQQDFKQKGQMEQHINAKHKNGADQRKHQCAFCEKDFADPSALSRHIKNEAKKTPEQIKKTNSTKHYVKDDAARVSTEGQTSRMTNAPARRSNKLAKRAETSRQQSPTSSTTGSSVSETVYHPLVQYGQLPEHNQQCTPGYHYLGDGQFQMMGNSSDIARQVDNQFNANLLHGINGIQTYNSAGPSGAVSNSEVSTIFDMASSQPQSVLPAGFPRLHHTGDQSEPVWALDPALMPRSLFDDQQHQQFIDHSFDIVGMGAEPTFGFTGQGELPGDSLSDEIVADMCEPPLIENNGQLFSDAMDERLNNGQANLDSDWAATVDPSWLEDATDHIYSADGTEWSMDFQGLVTGGNLY